MVLAPGCPIASCCWEAMSILCKTSPTTIWIKMWTPSTASNKLTHYDIADIEICKKKKQNFRPHHAVCNIIFRHSRMEYRLVPRMHDNFWIYSLVCLAITKIWRMMSCLEFCHTEQVSREKGTVEAVLRSVRHPRTPSSPFFTSPLFSIQGKNEACQLSHTEDPRRDTWSK